MFVYESLLCYNGFRKNRHGESHTLVRGISKLLSVLSASLVHLGWNWCDRSANSGVQLSWV
jgi:hypothetical protein